MLTLTLAARPKAPPPARPEPGAGAVPPRPQPGLHKLVRRPDQGTLPAACAGVLAGHPGDSTHPRSQPAGRPLRRPRARLPGAASPQPRSAGAQRPGARTPLGCPGSLASGLTRPDTGRCCRARRGCGQTTALSPAAEPAGAERAAGGRRASGHRLCTCSLARLGDSGRPPRGPRGARAAALSQASGRGRGLRERRPQPALALQTKPLWAPCQARTLPPGPLHIHTGTHGDTHARRMHWRSHT